MPRSALRPRRLRTTTATAVAVATGLAMTAAIFAAPASAATGPAISGSATPASVSATHSSRITYTVTSDLAYTAASVAATPGPLLAFVPGSAEVDGVSQPTVAAASTITVPLADGTAGSTHSVSYLATPVGTASATAAPAATLSFSDSSFPGGSSVTAASVALAVNSPDLAVSLAAGSGQTNQVGLPLGGTGYVEVSVANAANGAPGTTLFVDLPPELAVDEVGILNFDADSDPICTPVTATPGRLACLIGAISLRTPADLLIPLDVTGAAVLGQTVTLSVSAQPTDPTIVDANPSNNAITQQVTFIPTPKLVVTESKTVSKLAIGQSTQVTVSVRNDGADMTGLGFGDLGLENAHFAITGFDGKEIDPNDLFSTESGSGSGDVSSGSVSGFALAGLGGSSLSQARQARLDQQAASHPSERSIALSAAARGSLSHVFTTAASDPGQSDDIDLSQERLWDISGLKHGQTITAHLTLQAKTAGSDELGLLALSDPSDPGCLDGLDNLAATSGADGMLDLTNAADLPSCVGVLGLEAVKAAVVAAPVVASPQAASAQALPATGSPTTTPTVLAALLVLAGGLALRLGRRRS